MPRLGKEEERIEKIIRGLLKLPDNRRCINCNSLGPQYVCTTFWTFVCTSCSGVHREFTHRVKSVSMAKFNAEEVSCLQAAGNERAKQIYFKAWDPQRNSYPEPGNLHRLREFIKHVYMDRKYSGGRDSDKLAMVKVDPKEERSSFEKSGRWAKEEDFERRSFEKSLASGKIELRNFIEERSPRVKEIEKPSSSRRSRSTARFEIVDDRFKDDSYGSGRRSRLASSSLSPDSQKSREKVEVPQVVRPLKEILGSSFPPKANDRRDSDGAANAKKTAPSTTQGSTEGKVPEKKTVSLSSLIDFTEPDSPQPQNQLAITAVDSGSSSSQPQSQPQPVPSNMNSVESLLFDFSSPAASPHAKPADSTNSGNTTVENELALVPISSGDDVVNSTDGQLTLTGHPHQPTLQTHQQTVQTHQQTVQTHQQTMQTHQQSWSSLAPNVQTPFSSAPPQQLSQPFPRPAQETSSENGLQMARRKELPADIFALSYSAYQTPVQNNWQYRPTPGMGYGMQYQHPAAAAQRPGFPSTARSTNPFDLGDDTDTPPQSQPPSFPSIFSTQGAFPQVPTSHMGLQHRSSPYEHLQPQYQPSLYGMNMAPGSYMGQQHPNNILVSRPQGNNNAAFALFNHIPQPNTHQNGTFGSGGDQDSFASLNPLHLCSGRSQATGPAPNSYSSTGGGNPFG